MPGDAYGYQDQEAGRLNTEYQVGSCSLQFARTRNSRVRHLTVMLLNVTDERRLYFDRPCVTDA